MRLQREEAEERITKELEELREKKEALEAESDKNKTDLAEVNTLSISCAMLISVLVSF